MSDIEQNEQAEEMEFSLADLAGFDASEIAEVRFENLPAGVYRFRGVSAQFEDTTNRDDERRIVLITKSEVIDVKSVVDRNFKTQEDRDSLLGKKHTEKFYVVPEKAAEGLGLIRAFLGDIGLPNEGPFGGVPGSDPGIVDQFEGHEFDGKIRVSKYNGNDMSNLQIEKPKGK